MIKIKALNETSNNDFEDDFVNNISKEAEVKNYL